MPLPTSFHQSTSLSVSRHAQIQKIVSEGFQTHPSNDKSEPSASETPFKKHFTGWLMMAQY